MLLLELSLSSSHVLHEELRLATELDTGTETSAGRASESLSGVLLLTAEDDLEARLGLTLAQANVDTGDLAGSLALTGLVGDLESAELERRNTEGTNELANLEASASKLLVSRLELHCSLLLLEHLLVTLESETVNLTLESLACSLPLLQDTLSGLELGLKNHLVLQ